MSSQNKQKGNPLWRTHKFIGKWFGLLGIPFYIFFSKASVAAKVADPSAGLLDIGIQFYGNVASTAVDCLIPGAGIVLGEIFNFIAQDALPVLAHGFNAVAGEAGLLPSSTLPTPSLT